MGSSLAWPHFFSITEAPVLNSTINIARTSASRKTEMYHDSFPALPYIELEETTGNGGPRKRVRLDESPPSPLVESRQ
jgi:hypothetical protein